ncbi:MAG TPA: glycosyltransferase family 9 protein [Patescibacteria group bacterium]|jgi:ADP-heptose:LPS heptosyltransferase|nr:glycosyltransferase family 9 protein [Patescibacteria group bacterium]
MDQLRNILLIRLKSMGDIVFTLPAVHALRASSPQARITFLVSKEYAPLLQGFREVDSVIELDREPFRTLHPIKMARGSVRLLRQMRDARLDLTIDFQGYGETALLTWASLADARWGTIHRPGRSWAYTRIEARRLDVHPAQEYLLLLRRSGFAETPIRNQFILPCQAIAQAAEFFQSHGLRLNRPTLFVQPFTSASQKNWPLNRYLELAQNWTRRKWQVLFGGGPEDRMALEPARQAGYPVAAGVPLLVSAGLVKTSTLVLGADTGLVHLAVAMGKRVVMIIGSMFSGSTYPFQHPDWAIIPQGQGTIRSITTQVVMDRCAQASAAIGIAI